MAIPAAILQAQRASLFGFGADRYTYAPRASRDAGFAIYSGQGLGAAMSAYDLNQPGAIAEVKRTLIALGKFESDAFNPAALGVTEQTWKLLQDDDTWDGPAAEEFLLAASRYRGKGLQIPGPYVQSGLPGGGPQPTSDGLELLAGAARTVNLPPMKLYEAWRATGCTLQATCMNPPSLISKPPTGTPVTLTFNGFRLVPPVDADPALLAKLAAYDAQQQGLWQVALVATDEPTRAKLASAMATARANRDAAAQAAIDSAPGRQGTSIDTTQEVACFKQGGFWTQATRSCALPGAAPGATSPSTQASMAGPLAILAVAALGVYWVTKKKGAR